MKLAPHRSLTFWSGILVMAFICWAWWDSSNGKSWCRWDCFTVGNINGGVQVDSVYSGSGFIAGRAGKSTIQSPPVMAAPFVLRGTGSPTAPRVNTGANTYRGSLELMMTRRSPEAWLVFIPHWLLLLAVGLPWTALLLWRARRRKGTALMPT